MVGGAIEILTRPSSSSILDTSHTLIRYEGRVHAELKQQRVGDSESPTLQVASNAPL